MSEDEIAYAQALTFALAYVVTIVWAMVGLAVLKQKSPTEGGQKDD